MYHMLPQPSSVLVSVSGGPDSVALLHCLLVLKDEYHLAITVGHFNHQMRGADSDADACFVETLARDLALPFRCGTGDVKAYARKHNLCWEEAGRVMRYGFLRETAQAIGATRVALGHTLNDQAETVLMRLLRGAGTTGLCGIYPVLPLEGGVTLIRPLIECDRPQMMGFLQAHSLAYREDVSNQDLRFDRNRVRANLLPCLVGFRPNAPQVLAQHAALAQEEEAWMSQMVAAEAARLVQWEADGFTVEAAELAARPVALQRRLLRWALRALKGDLRRIEFAHVESLRRLCAVGMSGKQVDLPDALRVRREFSHLIFSRSEGDPPPAFSYQLPVPGSVSVPEANCRVEAERLFASDTGALAAPIDDVWTALLDARWVGDLLVVRSRRPGDRCLTTGGAGRKLKEVFIAKKVPRRRRDRVPLITRPAVGDAACATEAVYATPAEVLWVPGYFPPPATSDAVARVRVTVTKTRPSDE